MKTDTEDIGFYMIRYFNYLCELEEYFVDAYDIDAAIQRFQEDMSPEDLPNKFTIYKLVYEK